VNNKTIPVYILTGFLGSGKTTLLTKAVDYWVSSGKKPAIIMNEVGDVNLEGILINEAVPVAEMLNGCICCTIRGDLSLEINNIVQEYEPDVILIECTGIANPVEVLESVTDTAMLTSIELKPVFTVVDASMLLQEAPRSSKRTMKLMQDQIRCGSFIVVNKADKVPSGQWTAVEERLRQWNAHAQIMFTTHCQLDMKLFFDPETETQLKNGMSIEGIEKPDDESVVHIHESHDHVSVHMEYLNRPLDRDVFEQFVDDLPEGVYRAKGIVHFAGDAECHLLQYAYREKQILRIHPQKAVKDILVFIGENFSKIDLAQKVAEMVNKTIK
jgi:G3E family GTPase